MVIREIPRVVSAKDFQNALRRLGVQRLSGNPPDLTFLNPKTGGTATVGLHHGVKRHFVKAALRDLGITEEEFLRTL